MSAVPLQERWFEDYAEGEAFEFGDHLVTEQEIIEFAQRYDPQPFHLDHAAAAATHFGGLVGSGWMSCAIMMRLLCDHFISRVSSMGSPGVDQVRWLRPVRPGDRLRARVRVAKARASETRPDRGIVSAQHELLNQRDEVVMTMSGNGFYRRRPAAGAAPAPDTPDPGARPAP
ncbi:MAG: MaoC family dehydratase [Rubrivivax sp.]|nr:MaoC family dehydratase [Rubrivivax sp.]